MKKVDIVTVNLNSGTQLKACVESIQKAEFNNSNLNKVIVVDNDSKDNFIELVEKLNFEKLEIIKNTENLGFGKACNQGAKNSTSDFILFLNPDAMAYEDKPLISIITVVYNGEKNTLQRPSKVSSIKPMTM